MPRTGSRPSQSEVGRQWERQPLIHIHHHEQIMAENFSAGGSPTDRHSAREPTVAGRRASRGALFLAGWEWRRSGERGASEIQLDEQYLTDGNKVPPPGRAKELVRRGRRAAGGQQRPGRKRAKPVGATRAGLEGEEHWSSTRLQWIRGRHAVLVVLMSNH